MIGSRSIQPTHSLHLTLYLLLLVFNVRSAFSLSAVAAVESYAAAATTTSSSVSGERHYSTVSYDDGTGRTGVGEFCISEWFNASCAGWQRRAPGDDVTTSVVVMTTALYGRMRSGRCIQMKYGQAGCRTDVLGQLDDECSGRPSCRFQVSSLLASVATPCDGELTPYLEASYACVRVSRGICSSSERHKTLTSATGYLPVDITSSPASKAGVVGATAGTQRCPWRIVVDPLQRIRVIIYAFGARVHHHEAPLGGRTSSCSVTVMFDGTVEKSLCQSSGARQMILHTSDSHQLTVHFRVSQTSPDRQQGSFMLYYEAIGCPTLKVPSLDGTSGIGAWVLQQDAGTAVVKCNKTDETWFLRCDGRQWKDHFGNCSVPIQSLIIAVIVGVLLGVVIGAVPLAMAYVCLKRKWRHSPPPEGYIQGNDEDLYDPITAGKMSLVSTVRPSTTASHQHHHQVLSGATPPSYCFNVGGTVSTRTALYPPSFQQSYCTGNFHHHQHSPNCYSAVDGSGSGDVVEQAATGLMTLTSNDAIECGLHHGACRRLDHVYESASFGMMRGTGCGSRVVGFVDEHNVPVSGTMYTAGDNDVRDVTSTTLARPLHYPVGSDGHGKMVV